MNIWNILLTGVWGSVRHPNTILSFTANPKRIVNSPVPWQASLLTLIVAIIGTCVAHEIELDMLEKVMLVIIGGAGGNLIGMSIGIKNNKSK